MELISFGVVWCLVFSILAFTITFCEGELNGAAVCALFGSMMSFLLAVLGVVREVLL